MVGLASEIEGDFRAPEGEISHEIEFAIEASRGVIDQTFRLIGLLLDVDGAGLSILEDDRIWHFTTASDRVTSHGIVGSDLGFQIATSTESVAAFYDADQSNLTLSPLGEAGSGMKFFAGSPLVTDQGRRLGAFWVGQASNRVLSDEDRRQLGYLAGLLTVELGCHLTEDVPEKEIVDSPSGETVTICSWTKRIRENGKWLDFEEFIQRRLGVGVTHGISEDSLEEMNRKLEQMSVLGRV